MYTLFTKSTTEKVSLDHTIVIKQKLEDNQNIIHIIAIIKEIVDIAFPKYLKKFQEISKMLN